MPTTLVFQHLLDERRERPAVMPDHPMKRKAIENAKRARELKDAGDALGRQVLILLFKGQGTLELANAYDRWRDVSIGKPNFHPKKK
jgi:hypothetical protein